MPKKAGTHAAGIQRRQPASKRQLVSTQSAAEHCPQPRVDGVDARRPTQFPPASCNDTRCVFVGVYGSRTIFPSYERAAQMASRLHLYSKKDVCRPFFGRSREAIMDWRCRLSAPRQALIRLGMEKFPIVYRKATHAQRHHALHWQRTHPCASADAIFAAGPRSITVNPR
jgi:hypothetical protein